MCVCIHVYCSLLLDSVWPCVFVCALMWIMYVCLQRLSLDVFCPWPLTCVEGWQMSQHDMKMMLESWRLTAGAAFGFSLHACRVGRNDWQFMQKINWRTGGSPTRKHGNTETPTLSSIWYHATHPSLCDPRYVSMISPPSSHFLPFSPSLLSHVYFIHPDSHIRDGIHYWITPLSTTVQLSPHVSFNIWWICFKGREGGREGVHICTHTQKWHLSWLGIAEQLLWYLGQRDKCQSSSNLAFHILEKKT